MTKISYILHVTGKLCVYIKYGTHYKICSIVGKWKMYGKLASLIVTPEFKPDGSVKSSAKISKTTKICSFNKTLQNQTYSHLVPRDNQTEFRDTGIRWSGPVVPIPRLQRDKGVPEDPLLVCGGSRINHLTKRGNR